MRNKREHLQRAVVLILAVAGVITSTAPFLTSSGLVSAQAAAPNWSDTGSLKTARLFHTTTLLANGKVLVAGGCNDAGCLSLDSAELYDPVTGTWGLSGGPNVDRVEHSATLLPNGKVLVAGGWNRGVVGSAELYDPVAGTWSFTGNLNVARADHTATLLPNGKVLVAGGNNAGGNILETELYDPATGTWSITGNLNMYRTWGHTQTLLPNGKVLVAGGTENAEWSVYNLSLNELYDPNTGTWSLTGSLNVARLGLTATLLPNGNVLVTGGENQAGAINNSAELYNPTTGTWSYTGSFSTGRNGHTATLLPDGKVLVAGGQNWHTDLDSADVYDPATGNWSGTAKLNVTRVRHTAVLLQNGKVLVVGGSGMANRLLSAELYDSGSSSTIDPIDRPDFFVRQQYRDFLNREAEPQGLQFYLDILNGCHPNDLECTKYTRGALSANFFRSPEFGRKGKYVMYLYMVSIGQRPVTPAELPIKNDPALNDRPLYAEFMTDLASVSTPNDDASQDDQKKNELANNWMTRPEIVSLYGGLNNSQFVQKLIDVSGVTPANQSWVAELNAGTKTRAQVLRQFAESPEVDEKFFKQSFVTMEYFGYLRRKPEDCHDPANWSGSDPSQCGFIFHNHRFTLHPDPHVIQNIIVRGFIESPEYRARF